MLASCLPLTTSHTNLSTSRSPSADLSSHTWLLFVCADPHASVDNKAAEPL
jgi:hypothetical protein